MANEIPTVDWETLLDELRNAVRQLEARDEHSSLEVAAMLTAALDIMRGAWDPVEAYGIIAGMMRRLAGLGLRHHRRLSPQMDAFLGEVFTASLRADRDATADAA